MKHGVSDATIYPLRMLASAILRGLKRFFFLMGVFQVSVATKTQVLRAGRNSARGLGARGETSETMHPVEQPAQPDAGT
jgi:hypothetical protein